MPSNRKKVACYLGDDEEQAFKEFQAKNDISESQAVNLLIRSSLIEKEDTPEGLLVQSDIESRFDVIESRLDKGCKLFACNAEKLEKLEYLLSYIENSLEQVEKSSKTLVVAEYLTDDQVASYVGVREETVKEWRLGLRKPRGTNICNALSKFDIHFGRWRVKDLLI